MQANLIPDLSDLCVLIRLFKRQTHKPIYIQGTWWTYTWWTYG